jgi:hypothetical protein
MIAFVSEYVIVSDRGFRIEKNKIKDEKEKKRETDRNVVNGSKTVTVT